MKDTDIYTTEELELFKKIESQNFLGTDLPELEQQRDYFQKSAQLTIKQKTKKKNFNIRLLEQDIDRIKATALKEGMPYQTYLSYIIHKIATGQISIGE
jgi:predicted DNA binding CopG/RHH family protein